MEKKVELIHTEEGTFDSDGDKYFPIHLTKDGKTSTFYCNYDAWQREQRWLNDLEFRREMEEKHKGQYESPIRPLDEFLVFTKDEEGYFTGMEKFEIKEEPRTTIRRGSAMILDASSETVLACRWMNVLKPFSYLIEVK